MASDRKLRVLIVEDVADDAALLIRTLERGAAQVEHQRVDTAAGLTEALRGQGWDIVIADYNLPGFSGPHAFRIVREEDPHVPFILVSGTVGEEVIVDAMRQGIDDYLLKDNLRRLPGAVGRAIEASEERRRRERAEESLQNRDAILLAISVAATRLLATDDWRQEIDDVLAEMGRSAGVSRVYLFAVRPDAGRARIEAEWVASGVPARGDNLDVADSAIEESALGPWAEELAQGRSVHGTADHFPPEIRVPLQKWDVSSVALVPILLDGAWWGTIGFDVCGAAREWSPSEIEALRIAADTVGAAIRRAEVRGTLQRQLEHLRALRTIDRAIANSLDLQLTLDVVLDQVVGQLRVDAAAILLLDPMTRHLGFAAGRGIFEPGFRSAVLGPGDGLAGKVALERRAIDVPDLTALDIAPASRDSLLPRGFASYFALPMIAKNEVMGVLETFHREPLERDEDWREFAATLAGQAAIAIDNARMLADLTRSNSELWMAYETTLAGWSRALDLRDNDTQGHTERVAELTVLLGRSMGMDESEIAHLRHGALLHDIGKMGIPDSILHKPGPLTEEEWEVMRRHPVYAYELLSPIPYLRAALDIPHLHHERWDGSGYPLGLKGEEIPLSVRVFAVVDAWDALISRRPYRTQVRVERAREIIREGSGRKFDPRVVETFLRLDLTETTDSHKMTGSY